LTVTNSGQAPTDGSTVTVSDTLPAKLTPTVATGSGWGGGVGTCSISGQSVTCIRSDALNAGGSYPPITITVNLASDEPLPVTDTETSTVTPTAAAGSGWGGGSSANTCGISGQTVTCTRSDVLNAGGSYPAITITVSIAIDAPASVTNTATVSGGGDASPGND